MKSVKLGCLLSQFNTCFFAMGFNFDNIATTYDGLNHLMTWGIDRCWRRQAVAAVVERDKVQCFLDIATGTGDLAVDILNHAQAGSHLVGIDLSQPMMDIAHRKLKGKNYELQLANAEELPFENESFDCVTVSFGVRNFTHLEKSLAEMHRVMKADGKLMILELSYPDNKLLLALYKIYALKIIPWLGSLFAGNRKAYEYLPNSILRFPKPDKFIPMLENAGFKQIEHRAFTFGVCRMYVAEKN